MYLVDTNIVSEAKRASAPAVNWLRSVDPSSIYLSVLTLGEIEKGISIKRRSDPVAAGHLAVWLERLKQSHKDRTLPITDRIAIEWGRIAAIRPRGDIDGLIAATAVVHGLVVVTRNVSDFEDAGVGLIDPWSM